MFIQYKISDGDIVSIQATISQRVDDAVLAERGLAQYELTGDINPFSKVNIVTGEIIPPEIIVNEEI